MATAKPKIKVAKVTKATKTTKVTKVAKVASKVSVRESSDERKPTGLSVSVYDKEGVSVGKISLPAELFGAKVNKILLAQAVRVFLANQREGGASTKTRGEVEGSTRKIYKQKGTGRARHGGIRAPIFVGGGITFGPKPRDYRLGMSKSQKRHALISALSQKHEGGGVIVFDGLESLEPKTKLMVKAFAGALIKGKILFAVAKDSSGLMKASRNIDGLTVMRATDLNPYMIISHSKLVLTKQALEEAKKHFV